MIINFHSDSKWLFIFYKIKIFLMTKVKEIKWKYILIAEQKH